MLGHHSSIAAHPFTYSPALPTRFALPAPVLAVSWLIPGCYLPVTWLFAGC